MNKILRNQRRPPPSPRSVSCRRLTSNRHPWSQDVLETFAFDNVCRLAFNVDLGCLAGDGSGESEFMRAFKEAATLTSERFICVRPFLWKVKGFFNIGSDKRMESIWGKDCLKFPAERWLDENWLFEPESPFRFPVFHTGPRTCLGKEMAYVQMKSIAACVVEEFDLDVAGKQTRPEPLLSITMRIKGGLHLKVKARTMPEF
ncbi:hypothetical protein Cgig2_001407 [Carnegiea gigantea]|uniref:Cytochrome P450 n=1 Tax=Carnegiea gigantea TaxID=171969 RepID=A0A9Q1KVU8_9CARY|nr:hypothetical protein Cgig2_001407 [Carnegiea gigantea]